MKGKQGKVSGSTLHFRTSCGFLFSLGVVGLVVKYHLSTMSFLFATLMPQQFVVISCLEPCFLPNSKFPSGTRFLPSEIINSATPSQSGKGDRYKMVDELFEVVKILHLYVNS